MPTTFDDVINQGDFMWLDSILERWKIVIITYDNDKRVNEYRRYVGIFGYMTYRGARKAVKAMELEDTMRNRFNKEYVIYRNKV